MEETVNPNECRICGCTKWFLVQGIPVCATCHPPPEENQVTVTSGEVTHNGTVKKEF